MIKAGSLILARSAGGCKATVKVWQDDGELSEILRKHELDILDLHVNATPWVSVELFFRARTHLPTQAETRKVTEFLTMHLGIPDVLVSVSDSPWFFHACHFFRWSIRFLSSGSPTKSTTLTLSS